MIRLSARLLAVILLILAAGPVAVADEREAAPSQGREGGEEKTPAEEPPADWRTLAPRLTVGGSLRLRYESRDGFDFDGRTEDFLLSRIRIHLKWEPLEWLTVFVEGQDSQIVGERAINEDAVPTIYHDDLDVHQAYVDVRPQVEVPTRIRAGRQKLKFATQRLISPLEWVNTARVWDGLRVTLGEEKERTLDVFASRLVPVDPNEFNDWAPTRNRYADSDFHGIYFAEKEIVPGGEIHVYSLFRYEEDADDGVFTLGGRFSGKRGPVDVEVEAAGQGGRFGDQTHRAAMAIAGVGVTADVLHGIRFGTTYNYGSGDSNAGDSTHETFDNLYPLNHAYYGYMDFFSLQNLHNLQLSVTAELTSELTFRLAYEAFWLVEEDDDAWYHAGMGVKRPAAGTNVDPYVGSEIDATVKYGLWNKRVALEAGYCHFFPGAYVRDTGDDRGADFFYGQVNLTF